MERRLWLVRHGYRQDYVDPRWSQTSDCPVDTPLSAEGMRQAQDLARAFFHCRPAHVFVSPYRRTIQTAQPLAQSLDMPLRVDPGLGEIQRIDGTLSMTLEDYRRSIPQIDLTYSSPKIPKVEESSQMARQRAAKAVEMLLSRFQGDLLLITHDTPLRGIVDHLLQERASVRCTFCGITELQRQGSRWILCRNGDVSHLSYSISPQRFFWDYMRRMGPKVVRRLNRRLVLSKGLY
ncbi:MAG: histidine phosphatase family protein [Cyanobacteria bacterium P01_F01_bin.42]